MTLSFFSWPSAVYATRLGLATGLLFSCLGCATIPPSYAKGDKAIWPRWGYRITNENDKGMDLEVIFQQYVFMCTAADGQTEMARDVFLKCAAAEATKRGNGFEEIPIAELAASHVRNAVDGVCSLRVGRRLKFLP